MQQGDVKLFQTNDDGGIEVIAGLVTMSGGLETATYLSLFGGNDDGPEWWGNDSEPEPSKQYTSETQRLLKSIPSTAANLVKIEQAAGRDLAWLKTDSIASSVDITATIPALNRVDIFVVIEARGEQQEFNFTENWESN